MNRVSLAFDATPRPADIRCVHVGSHHDFDDFEYSHTNDVDSKFYNKLIKFPFRKSAEKMWLNNKTYDVLILIDYNFRPIIKNKGSAIFLHVARNNYAPTRGCIAINKKDILFLISKIKKRTKIIIN